MLTQQEINRITNLNDNDQIEAMRALTIYDFHILINQRNELRKAAAGIALRHNFAVLGWMNWFVLFAGPMTTMIAIASQLLALTSTDTESQIHHAKNLMLFSCIATICMFRLDSIFKHPQLLPFANSSSFQIASKLRENIFLSLVIGLLVMTALYFQQTYSPHIALTQGSVFAFCLAHLSEYYLKQITALGLFCHTYNPTRQPANILPEARMLTIHRPLSTTPSHTIAPAA